MANKYVILESVGSNVERVRNYQDLEKHHPTWPEQPDRRRYAQIDGEREEYVPGRDGSRLVSKDFVLKVDGRSAVDVPSPLKGFIRRSARMDRWGTVEIYSGLDQSAELIGRVRHLHPIHVKDGDQVFVGQALGTQSNKAPGPMGVHTHVDIHERHLTEFKRYIAALESGQIVPDALTHSSEGSQHVVGTSVARPDRGLRRRTDGRDFHELQHTLNTLGYRDAFGHVLVVDGDLGPRTREAVQAFQRACGLPDKGVLGKRTHAALEAATGAPLLSDAAHPDHALYRQALAGVERLEQGGFAGDMARRNAASMLVFEAKVAGLRRIDHVVASVQGTGLFAVEGELHDPAHRRVYVDRGQAADRTVAQASEQLRTDALAMQRMQPRLDPQLEAHQPAPDVRIHAPHTDRRPSF